MYSGSRGVHIIVCEGGPAPWSLVYCIADRGTYAGEDYIYLFSDTDVYRHRQEDFFF